MIGILKTILFVVGAIAIGRLVWITLAKQDAADDDAPPPPIDVADAESNAPGDRGA